jgi:hypothetical protein
MRAALLVCVAACGQVSLGSIDDSGLYHAPDGAIPYTAGAACASFDASHTADPAPTCSDVGNPLDPACAAWPSTPSGYPFESSVCTVISDGGPTCVIQVPDLSRFAACPSADAIGDAFCREWAQQFVLEPGNAISFCEQFDTTHRICTMTIDAEHRAICGEKDDTMVVADQYGAAQCKLPCRP